jgi:hypothetical protein
MKKVLTALCTLALVCSCTFSINGVSNGKRVVCKGPETSKSFDFTDFTGITVNGSSDITINQGETYSVNVKANEEVFDYLDYEVIDGVLVLKNKDNVQIVAKTFKVYVTLPCLEKLLVNGAADAEISNYKSDKDLSVMVNGAGDFEVASIQVPSLTFTVNGAGDIDASDLDVETLTVSVNGAGDVDLSGKAHTANLSVSGAGDIDASELEMEHTNIRKSGFASIETKKKDNK